MKLNHCVVFLVVLIATVIASGGRLGDGEHRARGWGLISCGRFGDGELRDFDKGYRSVTESWECRSDGSAICTREVETCEPCEISGNKTHESRTYLNVSVGEGDCPPGWTILTTGCYKLTEGGNYQEAATNCRNAGGFLAEIDNQEEQTAIASFNQERVWLGATDIAKDGEWIWSHSGKEMIFTNWHNGEPNGDIRENCLDGWTDSTWNDIKCSANLPKALCELVIRPGWDCRSKCKKMAYSASQTKSSTLSGTCGPHHQMRPAPGIFDTFQMKGIIDTLLSE